MPQETSDTASPTPTPPPGDEALQSFIDKIKETIQLSLDEKELDLVIKRRLKKLDDWETWSNEARTAFSHLIAAEILSSKASDIRIDHAIAFDQDHQSAFDELLAFLKKRRRSTSTEPMPDKPID
ncbi:MAG: hypothetical protein RLZZ433_1853 [Pseudomonadota bacterium]|jgi:hypothetical protein